MTATFQILAYPPLMLRSHSTLPNICNWNSIVK